MIVAGAKTSQVDHHLAHAAAAFYEPPCDQSLVVSYDGGGNDGTFRTFLAERKPVCCRWTKANH